MSDDQLLEKIKKCLALSKSSNEYEAAAALQMAQKLMAQHGIDHKTLALSDIKESRSRSGAGERPAKWESQLAYVVGKVFGCAAFFSVSPYYYECGCWKFIGNASACEVTKYVFEVLLRQIKTARRNFIRTNAPRCKRSTKTRRADFFCEGFVAGVYHRIIEFADCDHDAAAHYIEKHYGPLGGAINHRHYDKTTLFDSIAGQAGYCAGEQVQLHHGVNGAQNSGLLEG